MTPAEFAAKLKNLTPKIEKLAPALAVQAGNEFLKAIKDRVFFEGKDTAGKSRHYSTEPIYVNPAMFGLSQAPSSKVQKAKAKQTKARAKAQQKEIVSLYLPGGYKELRQKAGKETDVMNYSFTNATQNAIKVIKTDNGAAIAITEKKASQIMKGHTQKNGSPILQPSADEIKEVTKFVQNAVQIKIKELLGA